MSPVPKLRAKVICAWCGCRLRDGEAPASHGICEICERRFFSPSELVSATTMRARARQQLEQLGASEHVEVDETAVVLFADEILAAGWVQAWVWIAPEEAAPR